MNPSDFEDLARQWLLQTIGHITHENQVKSLAEVLSGVHLLAQNYERDTIADYYSHASEMETKIAGTNGDPRSKLASQFLKSAAVDVRNGRHRDWARSTSAKKEP